LIWLHLRNQLRLRILIVIRTRYMPSFEKKRQ